MYSKLAEPWLKTTDLTQLYGRTEPLKQASSDYPNFVSSCFQKFKKPLFGQKTLFSFIYFYCENVTVVCSYRLQHYLKLFYKDQNIGVITCYFIRLKKIDFLYKFLIKF